MYWITSPENIFKESFIGYQREWLKDKSKYKVGLKSRRCGLTWTEAFDDVVLAASSEGMDVFYLSTKEELGKEYISTCKEWVETFEDSGVSLVENPRDDIQVSQIRFKSGFRIKALTSNPKNLRGLAGRIVIDEAAFHEDLQKVLKAAIACTMWKGDIRLISTLNGIETFLEESQKILSGSKPGTVHTIPIDKALEHGLYLKIHQKQGLSLDMPHEELKAYQDEWLKELMGIYGDSASEELYCVPSTGTSSYFPLSLLNTTFTDTSTKIFTYFKSEKFQELSKEEQLADTEDFLNYVLLPVIDSYLQMNYTSFIGMDFARIRHLSVLSILFNPYEGKVFCPLHIELKKVPYPCQARIIEFLTTHLKDCLGISMDASGNALSLSEEIQYFKKFSKSSFMVFPIKFTQPSLRDIFNTYQNALESGKMILPADIDVKNDHIRLVEKNGIPNAVEYTSLRESSREKIIRHCDSAYSFALAYHCYSQFDPYYVSRDTPKSATRALRYSIGALRR